MEFSRVYAVTFDNVAVAAAQDFFELTPADDKPIYVIDGEIWNVGGTADAGDAQEEFWRWSWVRGHTTSGSGGSTPTPVLLRGSVGSSAGFTCEANNTTIASTAGTTVYASGFNVRSGWLYKPTPAMYIGASQADTTLVLRLLSTPADSVSMSGYLLVGEVY